LALGALLVAGCRQGSSTHEEPHDERDQHHDEHEGVHGEEDVVELSPEAVARIGLRTVPASLRPLAGRQATTGKVGFDETRLAHVGARVAGRLVRVEAELGDRLDEGAVLAVVDSVELGQARADYLRARARHEVAEKRLERERSLHADRIVSEAEVLEAEAEAREVAADLAASRETLALLGLANDEIEKLSWGDASASLVAVRAPFAGWVIAKEATRGELVTPEKTVVFVKTGEMRFERHPVELGQATDQWVEILSGLTAGEEVVTEGAFLLKSQASADQLGGHQH
jgi:cobalt-zinc-cadmium efflux system membrane fusion protein